MPSKPSRPAGKRQAPMPGPRGSAYRKVVAARKAAAARQRSRARASTRRSSGKSRKRPKSAAAFCSLKSRQLVVERLKRAIWARAMQINNAIVSLAVAGNLNAARALFDFAGVYSLPMDDEAAATPQSAGSRSASAPSRPSLSSAPHVASGWTAAPSAIPASGFPGVKDPQSPASGLTGVEDIGSPATPASEHSGVEDAGSSASPAFGLAGVQDEVDIFFRSIGVEPPCDEPQDSQPEPVK